MTSSYKYSHIILSNAKWRGVLQYVLYFLVYILTYISPVSTCSFSKHEETPQKLRTIVCEEFTAKSARWK